MIFRYVHLQHSFTPASVAVTLTSAIRGRISSLYKGTDMKLILCSVLMFSFAATACAEDIVMHWSYTIHSRNGDHLQNNMYNESKGAVDPAETKRFFARTMTDKYIRDVDSFTGRNNIPIVPVVILPPPAMSSCCSDTCRHDRCSCTGRIGPCNCGYRHYSRSPYYNRR